MAPLRPTMLVLCVTGAASFWLMFAGLCAAAPAPERPTAPTAAELAALINSLKIAAEATAAAAGAVSRLPSVQTLTTESTGAFVVNRSPTVQSIAVGEPNPSGSISNGTEKKKPNTTTEIVASGSTRLRGPRISQTTTATVNEEVLDNTGLLPTGSAPYTERTRRPTQLGSSTRNSSTVVQLSQTSTRTLPSSVTITTTTTTKATMLHQSNLTFTNASPRSGGPSIGSSGSVSSLIFVPNVGASPNSTSNIRDAANGFTNTTISVEDARRPASSPSASSRPTSGNTTVLVQTPASTARTTATSDSITSRATAPNGNTILRTSNNSTSTDVQVTASRVGAFGAFVRKRQETLKQLYAQLTAASADTAAALQRVVDEQAELNKIKT